MTNHVCLQDYIPEALAKLSDCEDPPSPTSSYDNRFLNEDEFSKPPPELPPQLPVTIRQQEPSISNTHLELNHLYIHKTDGEEFVALRSTNRFQCKYVTTLLYKSLIRERWCSILFCICLLLHLPCYSGLSENNS